MASRRFTSLAAALALGVAVFVARPARAQGTESAVVKKDVPYVPTPEAVVNRMLEMAELRPGDLVYDLGCGDGRIVIAAVRRQGVRGVCVDIDPIRIQESKANAARAGVADRIRFVEGDLFEVPFDDATVVTLYLMPAVNMRLRPRLQALKPGTRIVSHAFDLGDWEAQDVVVESGSVLYRWTVPPSLKKDSGAAPAGR
jgi:SAM-dependent methyltransferase